MQYLLLSRFQGALLGAAIGARLADAVDGGKSPAHRSQALNCQSHNLRQVQWETLRNQLLQTQAVHCSGEGAMQQVAESLIRRGELSREAVQRIVPATWDRSHNFCRDLLLLTLPVALFYHSEEQLLRAHLQRVIRLCQQIPARIAAVEAVGYAIALALRERLDPTTLIAAVTEFLTSPSGEITPQTEALLQLLRRTGELVASRACLDRAVRQLIAPSQDERQPQAECWPGAVALGFYCFLSTPEEPILTVQRTLQAASFPKISCLVAGTLSGAYNSSVNFPIEWRCILPTTTQYLNLSTHLLAAWSGLDPAVVSNIETNALPVVTAPHVIQRYLTAE